MIARLSRKKRGFTLAELAIVMGTIGVMLAGVWIYAGSAKQTQRVTMALQAIAQTAQATRDAFTGSASVPGSIQTVVPYLIEAGAMPTNLLRSATSTCNGTTTVFADTPWKPANSDGCGSFRVCAWNLGNTSCGSTQTQYFSVELTQLDYPSCLQLAEGISPAQPPGLKDVLIDGTSIAGSGLPAAPSTAAADCSTTSLNTLDFVYTLRQAVY